MDVQYDCELRSFSRNRPNSVNLQHLDERLDKQSTMRLLHIIASSMSLQYLPQENLTKEIPVITAKKFSLKLWVSENQPS